MYSAPAIEARIDARRLRSLQVVGIACGLAAGAWLGGAEAPIKIVNPALSPVTVSLIMVVGVFLARWSIPAFVRGTSYVREDIRQAPHLIIWAVIAGAMWAVANTLTIYAIRDVGLSIAFPLWNTNSFLGIFWGYVLFNELRDAGWSRWLGVLGGTLAMFAGATLLALASSSAAPRGRAASGVAAALGAGVLWGTMYVPCRKAYLSGMNPLSFITFFTLGELGTMTALAVSYRGAIPLWHEILSARAVLFWLMLGGFVWVIGDLFQQYAAKYVGIGRGIPLSNSNQLWGLLWAVLVFHELEGGSPQIRAQVIGGSILMALGAIAIALSSATGREHSRWQSAAEREGQRYGIDAQYVQAGIEGREFQGGGSRRTWIDILLVATVMGVFIVLGAMARIPRHQISLKWTLVLSSAMLAVLVASTIALWRATRFS